MVKMLDVTHVLAEIERGDPCAAKELLPLVYNQLRNLAEARMAAEMPDHTLQATALVHEAYLRLVNAGDRERWDSRGHFFAAAAEAMRRILIDQARRKNGPTAGGDRRRVELTYVDPEIPETELDIESLNDALDRLSAVHQRSAEVVKLRFFSGLTIKQTAQVLNISVATAKTDWAYARSWLRAKLLESDATASCHSDA